MTPVYFRPAHSDKEQKSTVFDFSEPGKVIAVFYGDDHRENAEEFCEHFHGVEH